MWDNTRPALHLSHTGISAMTKIQINLHNPHTDKKPFLPGNNKPPFYAPPHPASVAYTFSIPALSMSKCRYLQSLLQCAKANALRLNELSHTELMYIAALTPTQLVIIQA